MPQVGSPGDRCAEREPNEPMAVVDVVFHLDAGLCAREGIGFGPHDGEKQRECRYLLESSTSTEKSGAA